MAAIRHFTDLIAYQKAFELGLDVFRVSKGWPSEERYALTDQVRRSARSVGANIAEAWGKRRYEAHFISKFPTPILSYLKPSTGFVALWITPISPKHSSTNFTF